MFTVTRLRVPEAETADFTADVDALVAALADRPGFREATVGRAADEPALWVLLTSWEGVGAWRRALSAAEVKIAGAPVWVRAFDEPGAFLPREEQPG